MNVKEIIVILEEIRLSIIELIIKNKIKFSSGLTIEKDYKIVEYTDIMESHVKVGNPCDIYGLTMIKVVDWNKTKDGIRSAKNRTVDFIAIRNKEDLSIEAIIHTFLHELAHTITMPELHKSVNMEKKIKKIQPMVNNTNKFIPNHHSPAFYANFSRLLRIADELDIYQLPKTHRNFTVRSIHRYDTMINPCDNLSLGYSKRYSK
jgi:hypothetical protein